MPDVTPAQPEDYASFLVRYWYEPEEGCWYSEVEHVQSGTRQRVATLDEVQTFVLACSSGTQLFEYLRQAQSR